MDKFRYFDIQYAVYNKIVLKFTKIKFYTFLEKVIDPLGFCVAKILKYWNKAWVFTLWLSLKKVLNYITFMLIF